MYKDNVKEYERKVKVSNITQVVSCELQLTI